MTGLQNRICACSHMCVYFRWIVGQSFAPEDWDGKFLPYRSTFVRRAMEHLCTASHSPARVRSLKNFEKVYVERRGRESNSQIPLEMSDYKSAGLASCPTSPRKKLALPMGLEPTTCRLRICCSRVTDAVGCHRTIGHEALRLR